MAVALLLGAGAAVARAAGEGAICRELREDTGLLRLPGPEGHLSVLVTGDSMSYPIDQEMGIEAPRGMVVHVDRHDGTGLTTTTVNWARLAARQVARFHPDATVISLGGRDGGIPLPTRLRGLTECCGRRWLRLYANLLRPLVRAYVHGGARPRLLAGAAGPRRGCASAVLRGRQCRSGSAGPRIPRAS